MLQMTPSTIHGSQFSPFKVKAVPQKQQYRALLPSHNLHPWIAMVLYYGDVDGVGLFTSYW